MSPSSCSAIHVTLYPSAASVTSPPPAGRHLRFALGTGSCTGNTEIQLLYGTVESQDQLLPAAQSAYGDEDGSGDAMQLMTDREPEGDLQLYNETNSPFSDGGCNAWEVVHTYRLVTVTAAA